MKINLFDELKNTTYYVAFQALGLKRPRLKILDTKNKVEIPIPVKGLSLSKF